MGTESGSRRKRLASQVYDAGAGSRIPILDGPGWLIALLGVAAGVAVFGSRPWTWLVAPVAVVLVGIPSSIRWVVSIWRAVGAFRAGFRS